MPTINERLEAAKAALVEAKDGEDAEALTSAIAEFKAASKAKEEADEADSLIKSLSNSKEEKSMDTITEAKTIGEYALKNLDLTAIRNGAAKTAGTEYGFKAYTDPQVSQTVNTYSTDVADQGLRDLAVRGLFGAEQISGNAITFFTLGAKEDNSAPSPKSVSEAAAKPQFHIVEGTVTKALQKIAGWFYETDELLDDNPYLATALNNRGLYELDAAVEDYLLTTLAATSGIGAKTYANGTSINPDVILDAIMDIKKDTASTPTPSSSTPLTTPSCASSRPPAAPTSTWAAASSTGLTATVRSPSSPASGASTPSSRPTSPPAPSLSVRSSRARRS